MQPVLGDGEAVFVHLREVAQAAKVVLNKRHREVGVHGIAVGVDGLLLRDGGLLLRVGR